MQHIYSQNPQCRAAHALVQHLQRYFVDKLNTFGDGRVFEPVEWFRDAGRHGGGTRFEARNETLFNRASVNVSQVHYADIPEKKLDAASAVSTIIHPRNPHVPSKHMHISYTRMKSGSGYWRIMADLNPSIIYEKDRLRFLHALKSVVPTALFEPGCEQGDRYFYIPALGRHRGTAHFYLEHYGSGDFENDLVFARAFGERIIDVYLDIISDAFLTRTLITDEHKAEQLAYHTLYFFQVLTLDRGTTSGLLIHDQNDIGIMGSLPSHVDRRLLQNWLSKMTPP